MTTEKFMPDKKKNENPARKAQIFVGKSVRNLGLCHFAICAAVLWSHIAWTGSHPDVRLVSNVSNAGCLPAFNKIWVFPKIGVVKPPQIIPCLVGFSIIFTIHFGVPLFLETPMMSVEK